MAKTPRSTKKTTAAAPPEAAVAAPRSTKAKPPAAPPEAAVAAPLQPGDPAPEFSLAADDGQTYSRASLAGRRFVIYFYPKDSTPGCTQEACDFRDAYPQLTKAGIEVLGVSSDGLASHARFRTKHALGFPLLSDPERTVAQAFGVVGLKKLYGKTSIGVVRSTFVVGPKGIIEHTFSPVKVNGHAQAVLAATTGS